MNSELLSSEKLADMVQSFRGAYTESVVDPRDNTGIRFYLPDTLVDLYADAAHVRASRLGFETNLYDVDTIACDPDSVLFSALRSEGQNHLWVNANGDLYAFSTGHHELGPTAYEYIEAAAQSQEPAAPDSSFKGVDDGAERDTTFDRTGQVGNPLYRVNKQGQGRLNFVMRDNPDSAWVPYYTLDKPKNPLASRNQDLKRGELVRVKGYDQGPDPKTGKPRNYVIYMHRQREGKTERD